MDTDQGALGSFDPNRYLEFTFGGNQGSHNLSFGVLSNPRIVDTSDYASFDPYPLGEYSFALTAIRRGTGGTEVGRAAIRVWVGEQASQVPEPASMALFGMGLLGLGFARRLRRT